MSIEGVIHRSGRVLTGFTDLQNIPLTLVRGNKKIKAFHCPLCSLANVELCKWQFWSETSHSLNVTSSVVWIFKSQHLGFFNRIFHLASQCGFHSRRWLHESGRTVKWWSLGLDAISTQSSSDSQPVPFDLFPSLWPILAISPELVHGSVWTWLKSWIRFMLQV